MSLKRYNAQILERFQENEEYIAWIDEECDRLEALAEKRAKTIRRLIGAVVALSLVVAAGAALQIVKAYGKLKLPIKVPG